MQILEERKRREVDPTLTMLRECVIDADNDKAINEKTKQRIKRMLEFTETMTDWYTEVRTIPKPTLVKLMKLGSRVVKFLPSK